MVKSKAKRKTKHKAKTNRRSKSVGSRKKYKGEGGNKYKYSWTPERIRTAFPSPPNTPPNNLCIHGPGRLIDLQNLHYDQIRFLKHTIWKLRWNCRHQKYVNHPACLEERRKLNEIHRQRLEVWNRYKEGCEKLARECWGNQSQKTNSCRAILAGMNNAKENLVIS